MKNLWKLSVLALLLISLVACGAQTGQATPSDDVSTPADILPEQQEGTEPIDTVAPTEPVIEEEPIEGEGPVEDTPNQTTTATSTGVTATTTTCNHTFSKATCESPATCRLCGKTQGEKGSHTYSNGVCTVCGASDPAREGIAKALKDIERYPKYIAINKDLLDTHYDLFKLNGEAKHFNDAHETTLEIHDYLQKMIEKCEKYADSDPMIARLVDDCRECNLEMPIVPGSASSSAMRSYISDCKSYARKADRISTLYNTLCRSYGVE